MKKLFTLFVVLLTTICANATDITVYVKASSAPYLYVWNSNNDKLNEAWPGTQMTETKEVKGETYYYKTFTGQTSISIILNDNNGNQTADITGLTEDSYFTWDGGTGYTKLVDPAKTYYIKTNFGGGESWTWKELTLNANTNPATYSVTAIYGGKGCNWNTSASDDGSTWVGSPTLSGDPVSGDQCEFTLTPSTGVITITKVEATKYTFTVASAGNGTVWIDGSSELTKEVNEGATVKVGALASDGYYFKNWTVDGTEVSKCHLYTRTVNATETLTANFTTEAPTKERVYFANTSDWTTVDFYGWDGEAGVEYSWPGTAMTKADFTIDGHDVYYFDAEPGEFDKVIFNDGTSQTANLEWTAGKCYTDNWYDFTTVEITAAKYATYYNSSNAYKMPADVTGYIFNSDSKTLVETYTVSTVVPAKEALVLGGKEGKYALIFTTTTNDKSGDNALLGTDDETDLSTQDDASSNLYYALSLAATHADGDYSSVGFYWMKAEGAAFTNGAHKAYLKLAKDPAAKAGYAFNDEDASAINAVEATLDMNAPVYNLQGQRVSADTKGILIQNGRKYINK